MKKTLIAHFFTTINTQIFLRSVHVLISPYFWFHMRKGKYVEMCEQSFVSYLWTSNSRILSFYNARSALYHGLKMLESNKNIWKNEVIVQAYTCVSVINAIIQAGYIPRYVDIDSTLNIDIATLPLSEKTRAIIVQHTFGYPADIEQISKICREKNIVLIEDCAHSLGSKISDRKVGTFGDFAIFSTGRDKVISTVTWGFLLLNNQEFFQYIPKVTQNLLDISLWLAFRNVMYNIVAYISNSTYSLLDFGKIFMFLVQKIKLLPAILTLTEKKCNFPHLHFRLPNSLAYLWVKEIDRLDQYLQHRTMISQLYIQELSSLKHISLIPQNSENTNNFFWFPVFTDDVEELRNFCKQRNILLGNYWTGQVIVPIGTDTERCLYTLWTCTNAEKLCTQILTLPTHFWITKQDAQRVIETLKAYDNITH